MAVGGGDAASERVAGRANSVEGSRDAWPRGYQSSGGRRGWQRSSAGFHGAGPECLQNRPWNVSNCPLIWIAI